MKQDPAAGTIESSEGVVVVGFGTGSLVCWPDHSPGVMLTADEVSGPAAAYEALRAAIDTHEELVVVVPRLDSEDLRTRAGSARSLLPPGVMSLHQTSLPPLAAAALVALASRLSGELTGRGELAAAMPMLEREILSVACMSSVTRLRHPSPSVLQHAQSFLPSSRFTVTSHPHAMVQTVRERLLPNTLPTPAAEVSVVATNAFGARGELGGEALIDLVQARFDVKRRSVVDVPETSTQWWGSRTVELVAYPEDVGPVVERVRRRMAASSCDWCGAAMAGERCELCGMLKAPRSTEETAA